MLSKLLIASAAYALSLVPELPAAAAAHSQPLQSVHFPSRNGRFEVLFESSHADTRGLWNSIVVLDRDAQSRKVVHVAYDARSGEPVEVFFPLDAEDPDPWSPDGNFFAYWDDYCIDEPGVEDGVICHSHEIHFLSVKGLSAGFRELALDRYEFDGWVAGKPHTVRQRDQSDGAITFRRPYVGDTAK